MAKSKAKASPAKIVNPISEFLAQAVKHFESGSYAEAITVGVQQGEAVVNRASFSAGVFKADGMMCLIVENVDVLTDYTVMGEKKVVAMPKNEWFGTDPLVERKAIAAKAQIAAKFKADSALAQGHIAAWAAAHVADPRAIKVLQDLAKVATRCGERGQRFDGAVKMFGATGKAADGQTWLRVDKILTDIKTANSQAKDDIAK